MGGRAQPVLTSMHVIRLDMSTVELQGVIRVHKSAQHSRIVATI